MLHAKAAWQLTKEYDNTDYFSYNTFGDNSFD
jgi:hypothetical protein